MHALLWPMKVSRVSFLAGWWVVLVIEAAVFGWVTADSTSLWPAALSAITLGIVGGILLRSGCGTALAVASGGSLLWVTVHVIAMGQAAEVGAEDSEAYGFVWGLFIVVVLPLMSFAVAVGRAVNRRT